VIFCGQSTDAHSQVRITARRRDANDAEILCDLDRIRRIDDSGAEVALVAVDVGDVGMAGWGCPASCGSSTVSPSSSKVKRWDESARTMKVVDSQSSEKAESVVVPITVALHIGHVGHLASQPSMAAASNT
jgi:hypothetical protein